MEGQFQKGCCSLMFVTADGVIYETKSTINRAWLINGCLCSKRKAKKLEKLVSGYLSRKIANGWNWEAQMSVNATLAYSNGLRPASKIPVPSSFIRNIAPQEKHHTQTGGFNELTKFYNPKYVQGLYKKHSALQTMVS